MAAKNSPAPPVLEQYRQKELQLLYARRMAIDALIRSLAKYDRYQAKHLGSDSRKTA
jgi:hypothetical protein